MFRALQSRNYRLYFVGQLVSLAGTWMQMMAISWLVYRLTNSALMLGVIGFASQIPTFVLTPFTGVVADRLSRRDIQVITQTLSMLQAFVLSFLVLSGSAAVWQLVPLSLFLGIVNAFDAPARQAFTIDLVECREDLVNAVALNSIMFNAARLVGPSIAGVLIAVIGEGGCFLLNGLSFLAVIVALLAMRIAPQPKQVRTRRVWQEIREGAIYAFGFAPIRILLLFSALLSLVIQPFQTLLPVVVKEVLHRDASILGFLMGVVGVGSLAGGLYMAQRKDVAGLERRIALAAAVLGAGLFALSLSRALWLSLPLALIVGFTVVVQGAATNTLLQMIVEDDKRGRVMSFFTMAFLGMMPFGSLLGGALAGRLGAPTTLLLAGCAAIGAALFFTSQLTKWTEAVHPVYVRMGIAEHASVVTQAGLPADGSDGE